MLYRERVEAEAKELKDVLFLLDEFKDEPMSKTIAYFKMMLGIKQKLLATLVETEKEMKNRWVCRFEFADGQYDMQFFVMLENIVDYILNSKNRVLSADIKRLERGK